LSSTGRRDWRVAHPLDTAIRTGCCTALQLQQHCTQHCTHHRTSQHHSGRSQCNISVLTIGPGWLVHTNQPAQMHRDVSWSRRELDRRPGEGWANLRLNKSFQTAFQTVFVAGPSKDGQITCRQGAAANRIDDLEPVESSREWPPTQPDVSQQQGLSSSVILVGDSFPFPPSSRSRPGHGRCFDVRCSTALSLCQAEATSFVTFEKIHFSRGGRINRGDRGRVRLSVQGWRRQGDLLGDGGRSWLNPGMSPPDRAVRQVACDSGGGFRGARRAGEAGAG
jgi:hypothetical protein